SRISGGRDAAAGVESLLDRRHRVGGRRGEHAHDRRWRDRTPHVRPEDEKNGLARQGYQYARPEQRSQRQAGAAERGDGKVAGGLPPETEEVAEDGLVECFTSS